MTLKLVAVNFQSANIGTSSTYTEDRRTLSVLFDNLVASHQPQDAHLQPQVVRLDGAVQCAGTGWVTIQVRGACHVAGCMGLAHAMVWANGKPTGMLPLAGEETGIAVTTVPVKANEPVRLSLTALAWRDIDDQNAAAECWIDSIDIQVRDHPPGVSRRQRAAQS